MSIPLPQHCYLYAKTVGDEWIFQHQYHYCWYRLNLELCIEWHLVWPATHYTHFGYKEGVYDNVEWKIVYE